MITTSILKRLIGAILEYAATYLNIPERFIERGKWKRKDTFLFNEVQISLAWYCTV